MLMFRLQSLSLTLTGAGLMHTLRGAVPSIAPQRTNCRVNGSVVGYFATVNFSHDYQYAHFLNYRDTPIGLLTGLVGVSGLCPNRQHPPCSHSPCQPCAYPPTHLRKKNKGFLIIKSYMHPANTGTHTNTLVAAARLLCLSI